MKKRLLGIVVLVVLIVVAVVAFVTRNGTAQDQSWGDPSTDPQKLMIPRWFLSGLILNGETIDLASVQISLQFTEDGQINGNAGCNDYFATYEAKQEGILTLGPAGATKMFCENGSVQENAYLTALSQVTQFKTEQGQLILTSNDGKTALTFSMPPK